MSFLPRFFCPRSSLGPIQAGISLVLASSAFAQSRHLFLDPGFIQRQQGVELVVNPPLSREIVIQRDRPWEKLMISFYLSVIDEGGKLRMWYICRDEDGAPHLAYAESTDGVKWEKTALGIVDYKGSKANNLTNVTSLEGSVFRDPQPRSEDERYVYVSTVFKGGGIYRFTSRDGQAWRRDDKPLLPFEADSQNVAFWDTRIGKYVFYSRAWNPTKPPVGAGRKVVRLESERLDRPSGIVPARARDQSAPKDTARDPFVRDELPDVLVCDERDPPNTDIYTSAIQPYPLDPSWYVGFPAFYRHAIGSPHNNDGWTEIQFVGSRDGKKWERYNREAYLKPGPAGAADSQMLYIGPGLVVRGDELWQYGTGFHLTHGDKPGREREGDGTIYRYVHRVDGFVSLDFARGSGEAVTAPVKVSGPKLLLNLDGGALGELRVGLSDRGGRPIAGFTEKDCDLLRGNSTRAIVTWKGKGDLSALMKGGEVSVSFTGQRMKLYSFRFE